MYYWSCRKHFWSLSSDPYGSTIFCANRPVQLYRFGVGISNKRKRNLADQMCLAASDQLSLCRTGTRVPKRQPTDHQTGSWTVAEYRQGGMCSPRTGCRLGKKGVMTLLMGS